MNERFVVLLTTVPTLHESTRELASRLAARANATLLFLHVVAGASHGEAMLQAAVDLASGAPDAWLRNLRPSHVGVPFRHRLELGDPVDVTAGFVREHSVELLVVEEPPRHRIAEVLWRGLAEALIRRVDCPVVIGGPGFLRAAPPATTPIRPALGAGRWPNSSMPWSTPASRRGGAGWIGRPRRSAASPPRTRSPPPSPSPGKTRRSMPRSSGA